MRFGVASAPLAETGGLGSAAPSRLAVPSLASVRLAALGLATLGGAASAEETLPLDIPNLSPPVAAFGLPAWDAPVGGGRSRIGIAAAVGNHYVLAGNGHEELLIDGESWRLNLFYRHRFGEAWTVSVGVPWHRHSGGLLDDAVDAWHGFFNLPDGNRNLRGEDELRYLYKAGGQRRYLFEDPSHGIGDARIGLSRTFGAEGGFTLKAALKVPTGDPGALTGSGAADLAFSLLRRHPRTVGGAPAGVYWGVGAVRLGESEVFSLQSEDWVAFGVFGIGWRPLRRVGFKLQLDAHSNYFSSSLDELGASALQASAGGWWKSDSGRTLTFAFSEDLIVKSAPDFGIHIGLGWAF